MLWRLQGTVHLFLKTVTGRTLVLQADLDWPVWCFKKCIEDIEGYPVDDVRLIFAANQLENLPTLREYSPERKHSACRSEVERRLNTGTTKTILLTCAECSCSGSASIIQQSSSIGTPKANIAQMTN